MSRFGSPLHYLCIASALILVVAGCEVLDPNPGPDPITAQPGDTTGNHPVPPVDTVPASELRGAALWVQYCARCHGDSAQGTRIYEPSLRGRTGIHDIVRKGQKAMPSFPALSDSSIASIELYLRSFIKDPGSKTGLELYVAYCASCHGDSALGTKTHPGSIQGYEPIAPIVRSGRGEMKPVDIPDSLITRIQEYISSLRNLKNLSGQELYMTYCATCHGDSATGTKTYTGSIQGTTPIHDIVRNGQRDMKPVNIPDSLIAKIQEFLLTLKPDLSKLTGQEYYARACSQCHGVNGEGTARGYEIRNPVVGYATYVIRNGRPGTPYLDPMKAYAAANLTDVQLTEILTWLRNAVHPTDGKALFNRFCANCHGTDARGGIVRKGIRGETGDFAEKVRSGEGGSNYASRTKYMPKWSTSEISNAEITAMAAYVRTLP